MNRYQWYFQKIVSRDLLYKLQCENIHQIPHIQAISLNISTRETLLDRKRILPYIAGLQLVSGQKLKRTYASKSIAGFKLRSGQLLGAAGNLRRQKMYSFFDKLVTLVLPKIRDFEGIHVKNPYDVISGLKLTPEHELANSQINLSDQLLETSGLRAPLFQLQGANESSSQSIAPRGRALAPLGELRPPAPRDPSWSSNSGEIFKKMKIESFNLQGGSFLLYPELENHYELFESIPGFNITIAGPIFLISFVLPLGGSAPATQS